MTPITPSSKWHSPSTLHESALNFMSLTVLSLEPVATRSPMGLQAKQYMEPLWCLVRLKSTVGWYVVWSSLKRLQKQVKRRKEILMSYCTFRPVQFFVFYSTFFGILYMHSHLSITWTRQVLGRPVCDRIAIPRKWKTLRKLRCRIWTLASRTSWRMWHPD